MPYSLKSLPYLLCVSLLWVSCQPGNVKPRNKWEGTYSGSYTYFFVYWVSNPDSLEDRWLDTLYEAGEARLEVVIDRSENFMSFYTDSTTRFGKILYTNDEFTEALERGCYRQLIVSEEPPHEHTFNVCFTKEDSLILSQERPPTLRPGADEVEFAWTFTGKKE